MRRSSRSIWGDERGTASIEFIAATVLLLVPVLYLVIALAQIQNQSLGVEAASRHIARAYAHGQSQAHADRVLDAVAEQYGLSREGVTVSLTCVPASGACPRAGAIVRVSVHATATVPMVPTELIGGGIPIGATSVNKISEYVEQE